MAIGTYGVNRAADVDVEDIEILYTFTPNRQTAISVVSRLDPAQVLSKTLLPSAERITGEENLLEGLYNLLLPADTFNQIGIYNIYIRPKTYRTQVVDCGVLAAQPTVKGILLDSNQLDGKLISSNALQGYRVEYLDDAGQKVKNTFRIITTSNRVIPVTENIGNTSQTATRYRFDDSGSLIFCQVTPSSSSGVKPNLIPFIGTPGQKIIINNTFFNPVCLEVELTQHDIESVIDYVAGEQLKDVDNGIITHYDKDRNIIAQFNVFQTNNTEGDPVHEVKEKRANIDQSQNLDDVIDQIS
jgi:hypothetical protein